MEDIPEEYRGDSIVAVYWHPKEYLAVIRASLNEALEDCKVREVMNYRLVPKMFHNVNMKFFILADKYARKLDTAKKPEQIELSDILKQEQMNK